MGRPIPGPILLVITAIIAFALVPTASSARQGIMAVTDLAGRTVSVPGQATRIICVGPGCLRLICYLGAQGSVVGVEAFEKTRQTGRAYAYATPEVRTLPVIGPGGPANVNKEPDLEAVLKVKPEIIFATYLEKARADGLQRKIGIPVVTLSYGKFGSFDNELYSSLALAGKILGRERRAEEIAAFMEKTKRDLAKRTEAVSKASQPTVYVGGVGYRGAQGMESTETNYLPLEWIRARNMAKGEGKEGHLFVNKEKILAWDPDIILVDALGLSVIASDYDKKPQFYQALKAFKAGRVYILWPFNAYMTNVETVIIDAYMAGKILYPALFRDVAIEKKTDEVYTFFLGRSVAESMKKDAGVLGTRWTP
jgi:iron complex transport system substrate-binding protein